MKCRQTIARYLLLVMIMTVLCTSPAAAQNSTNTTYGNDGTQVTTGEVTQNGDRRELHMSLEEEYLDYSISEEKIHDYGALRFYFAGYTMPDLTAISIDKKLLKKVYTESDAPLEIGTDLGYVSLNEDVLRYLVKKTRGDSVEVVIEQVKFSSSQQNIYGENAVARKVYYLSDGNKITDMGFNTTSLTFVLKLNSGANIDAGRLTSTGKLVTVQSRFGGQVGKIMCKVDTNYLGTFIMSSSARIAFAKKATGIQTTALKASAKASAGAITVSWTKSKGFGVDGYQIYRSAKKTGTYKKVISTKKLSYKNTGLKKGVKYYYKVRGYRTLGVMKFYTKWSNIVSAKAK